MGLENIVVVGNATIDARLNKNVYTIDADKSMVKLSKDSSTLEIQAEERPIKPGGKYTAKKSFREELQPFSPHLIFGGGGYNSLMEILRLIEERSNGTFRLHYVDISTPSLDLITSTRSMKNVLHDLGVDEPLFINGRPMPLNLILDGTGRGDKIIIKSPIGCQKASYTDGDLKCVKDILRRSKGILANSLKDIVLANLISEYSSNGRRLLSVITTSLDATTVYDRLLPNGITIFNYDELGHFMERLGKDCFGHDANESERIEYAIDAIRRIRSDGRLKPIYVTLGPNGVLCADNGNIHHVRLKEGTSKKVQELIEKQKATTCGAGDCFAGAVFYYYMTRPNACVVDAGIEGCKRAANYLGYAYWISNSNDFEIKPHAIKNLKKAA